MDDGHGVRAELVSPDMGQGLVGGEVEVMVGKVDVEGLAVEWVVGPAGEDAEEPNGRGGRT